jgi:hypothetical protein
VTARLKAHNCEAEFIGLVPGAIEIVEVGCFAIAALGMAVKKAIEQLPIAVERRASIAAKIPKFFKSGNWNYAPLVLMVVAIGLWIFQNANGSAGGPPGATADSPAAVSSDNAHITALQSQVTGLQSALVEKTHELEVERQSKPPKSRFLQLDDAMKWRFVKAFQDTARKKNGDIETCSAVTNIQRNSPETSALWAN